MDWNPIDAWDKMADFLKSVSSTLPRQPKAIVMVSAHWLGPKVMVTSAAQPDLIYDYHGFPPHTCALTYPAPAAPCVKSGPNDATRPVSKFNWRTQKFCE